MDNLSEKELLERINFNVVQGCLDEEDEGFDGELEGEPGVTELVEKALETGVNPRTILMVALTPGMEEVGRKYESGEYLIPDMLAAAESVGAAIDILEPHLVKDGSGNGNGRFVMATVQDDLHDIGKNIVVTMLKGIGYEVIDLGTGVSSKKIVEAVREHKASYLGLSALLTTTMTRMKETIDLLEQEGLRGDVKVFIGGAPTSSDFARGIGADAHCKDAFEAIELMKRSK